MADSIDCAGESIPWKEGLTGTEIFSSDRTVIAMWLNGEPADLSRELNAGDSIAPITIDSDAGLDILRHSTGHVTAQAVQELFPGTKLGIGPYITDGYYFDFDVAEPFTPEDLKAIQKRSTLR